MYVVVVNKHAHVNLSLIKIQEKHSSWDLRQAIGTKGYVLSIKKTTQNTPKQTGKTPL